jgi:hypothetical protein
MNKLKTNIWYRSAGFGIDNLMSCDYPEVIDETLKYKIINEKLKYVHITKTSGTYVESLGKQKNLSWGINDKYLKRSKLPVNSNPSYWHLPLQFFDMHPYKKNTKLFTIVRNPYDRIISECLCKYGSKFSKGINTQKDLNIYIKQQVNKKRMLDLSFHHFLPQHLYTHKNGQRIVDTIIKYEELQKFNDLMKSYSINISYKMKEKDRKRKFDITDISKENIELINEIYDLDFKYYNYQKM